jgi:hypothetical protein
MTSRRKAFRAADQHALKALTDNPVTGSDGHIGDFVYWSIPTDWRMPCPDVAACLTKHGLDPVTLMPEATPYSRAFTRAVESVRASVRSLGYTLAEAKDGPRGEKRINVLHTTKAEILDPTDEGSILCPTHTRPYIERLDSGGVCTQILDKTDELVGVYKRLDLATSVAVLLRRWSAVPMLDGGYLLPPGGAPQIEMMKAAMAEMDAGFIGQLACYNKDKRSLETAARSVNLSFVAQLNEFSKLTKDYVSRDSKGTRFENTIGRAIEEAGNLKKKADMFKAMFGSQVDNIDAQVSAIETKLRDVLGVIAERESIGGDE